MVNDILQTPIEFLKGVGPTRASILKSELGIKTFQDLIYAFACHSAHEFRHNIHADNAYIKVANILDRLTEQVIRT